MPSAVATLPEISTRSHSERVTPAPATSASAAADSASLSFVIHGTRLPSGVLDLAMHSRLPGYPLGIQGYRYAGPMSPQKQPGTIGQKFGAIILLALLVFMFALFLRHASHTCPNGVVQGTLYRCR